LRGPKRLLVRSRRSQRSQSEASFLGRLRAPSGWWSRSRSRSRYRYRYRYRYRSRWR